VTDPLQQLANALCRGFGGWNLQHDRRVLTQMGNGTLEIDLLKKTCRFGRDYIPTLTIVDVLNHQLRRYLAGDAVATETIRSVTLSIALAVEQHVHQKDKSVLWFGEQDSFVGCTMDVRCTIGTDGERYKSEHRGYIEWPRKAG